MTAASARSERVGEEGEDLLPVLVARSQAVDKAFEDAFPDLGSLRTSISNAEGMIAGRDFSRDYPTDSSGAVISRAAASEMGLTPEEAVGKTISRLGGNEDGTDIVMNVLGVFEDANFESAHMLARPIVLTHYELWQNYALVRVLPTDMEATLETIEAAWTA